MPAIAGATRPRSTSWLWGHHKQFLADPLGFMTRCAREYGDAVPLRFGPVRFWVVSDPSLIGEVLTTRAGSFHKDMGLKRTRVLLGNGLLLSEGEEHSKRSRKAQPAFRAKAVEAYAEGMVEVTEEIVGSWIEGSEVRLAPELARLTLSIVARALFGADLLGRSEQIGAAITDMMPLLDARIHGIMPLPLWIPSPRNRRFVRGLRILEEAVYAMIAHRRREPGQDLLSQLLAAGEGDEGLTDLQLRDEVMTLFLAGHETTAAALGFTLGLLGGHPEEARRVKDEIDTVLGERRAVATDAWALPRTAAALHESMRLYPPAWLLGRQAGEDVVLGGRLRIRRGDVVGMSPYVVHRDERWFPDASSFRPDRFAADAPKPAPFTYFPFGGGKRACIGRSFALLEAILVLATILQRVELDMPPVRSLEAEPHLTLRPGGGLPARVRRRALEGRSAA